MNKFDFSARVAQLGAIVKAAEGIKDRKSKERKAAARATRKLQQIAVFEELSAKVDFSTLSEAAQEYIVGLTVEYTPGVQLDIQPGDSLIELLEEYKDVKDLYKKILKWCEKNDCHIDGVNIVENK